MLTVYDIVVGSPWKLFGAALNFLTGKSNFSIARGIAVVALAQYAVLLIFANVAIAPVLLPVFGLTGTKNSWNMIRNLEGGTSDVLSNAYRVVIYCARVMTLFGLGTLPLLPSASHKLWFLSGEIFWFVTGGALYLGADPKPKKQSALKRAGAWLKAHRPHVAERTPAPVPT
jgi:hypothetical protein